jgi:CheY-like chemotaxis protein
MDLPADLPLVEGDPSQVQQIVMNLVINAAEAVGDKTGTVEVTTGVLHPGPSQTGASVFLRVRDDGCGMDEATRAQIFDPFFSTKFTGRGLGLAAVQGIVRSHNGSIRVISAPGEGSTLEVSLPAMQKYIDLRQAYPPPQALDPLCGAGAILVVDDEEFVRRTAKASLEHYGYTVVEAENGRDGLELFRRMQDSIRLVLLDLTMPVMSGEETYRQIKAINPNIPVIVSSGYGEMEAERRLGDERGIDFIKKPYAAQKLADKVKAALAD